MERRIVVFFVFLAFLGQALAMAEIMATELMKESLLCILPMSLFVLLCLFIDMVILLTLVQYVAERDDFIQWLFSHEKK